MSSSNKGAVYPHAQVVCFYSAGLLLVVTLLGKTLVQLVFHLLGDLLRLGMRGNTSTTEQSTKENGESLHRLIQQVIAEANATNANNQTNDDKQHGYLL
jgi:hypothetical protein